MLPPTDIAKSRGQAKSLQPGNPSKIPSRHSGFALVIALVLMGLMVLFTLSLSTMLQVEMATTKHSKDLSTARENAYMGVLTALGELQAIAGPDARVTARADIFIGPEGLSDAQLQQSHWLGVWNAKNPDGSTMEIEDYQDWNELSAQDKIADAHWLISGNAGLRPDDPDYRTPLDAVPADGSSVILAGASEDYDVDEVRAPKVLVQGPTEIGHYAYWVSGENSKALVDVLDADLATSTDVDKLNRSFQIANRTGVGAVEGLDDYSEEDASMGRLMDLSVGYSRWSSGDAEALDDLRRARFHDLTVWSKGLLVDVKDGALKRDLTQAFEINESFAEHFPVQTFGSQELSDEAAANPTTAEPFYFVEDSKILNGSPNWGILRDYYQHYWTSTKGGLNDDYINFRKAHKVSAEGDEEPMFTPHWHGGTQHSDPYATYELPYQYESEKSDTHGDNYQRTSLITPIIAQIRISHAFELVQPDPAYGTTRVPVISFRPVITLYNPYNSKLGTSDFGFVSTLDPKITLTLHLSDGARTVEFYQAELHTANKQGTLKVSLGNYTAGPGELIHQAFVDSPYAKVESNSGANADYVKPKWQAVGGLRFPLNVVDDDHRPDHASQSGAVSRQEASDSGVKENSWHPKWGISADEKAWLEQAVNEDAPMAIKIEYDDFGMIRSYTNSTAAGQSYHKIADVWRANSDDQPETFSTSFPSMSAATAQDSFETLALSLRSTERLGGEFSQTDALRNLIDLNVRAIHSNSAWDGDEGASRYLSLFDVEALGQNQQEPESYTNPQNDVKHGFWGRSIEYGGQDSVILFERPREPLLSLGQLQHANLGRYHFDPTYIVGNSYANVRIPLDETKVTDFGGKSDLNYYDMSYLVNERLWDGFFFSSLEIPSNTTERDAIVAALDSDTAKLSDFVLNPRMEFIQSATPDSDRYERIVVSDPADEDFKNAIYRPASEMWVNGAFNVNSTSVEAWKAILASSQDLRFPVYDPEGSNDIVSEDDVVISRVSRPYNRGFDKSTSDPEEEFWKGYRLLSSDEIEDLAESIVEEIKARGPFLSMASFVNRQLSDTEAGKKGALQAALDTPALGSDGASAVNDMSPDSIGGEAVTGFTEITNFLPENLSETDSSIMGFPGYVMQGDILQRIGPLLTVRDDTFVIRSYGDAIDPLTKEVVSQAWCEAVVQRTVEPMPTDDDAASEIDELIRPTSEYGRRFEIVSFRWLEKDEI